MQAMDELARLRQFKKIEHDIPKTGYGPTAILSEDSRLNRPGANPGSAADIVGNSAPAATQVAFTGGISPVANRACPGDQSESRPSRQPPGQPDHGIILDCDPGISPNFRQAAHDGAHV